MGEILATNSWCTRGLHIKKSHKSRSSSVIAELIASDHVVIEDILNIINYYLSTTCNIYTFFYTANVFTPHMSKILIKTPEQISGIRKAANLTARTLDMIGQYIRPGVSTLELDNIMNTYILTNGGTSACIDYLGNNKWGK